MKNKNVKVIDQNNIDRDANIMFAIELDGSEYVVYWISRDEESNNIFVSKVLKNIDNTYNMLNIEDEEKKKEIADIVKILISNSVSDQKDKIEGTTTTLSNGKVAKFVVVSFNKEQQIDVTKTYITTVKKEVTKVAETYYDVAEEEAKVENVLAAAPVLDTPQNIFPEIAPTVDASVVVQPAPAVVEPITVAPIVETSSAVAPAPTVIPTPVAVETPAVVVSTPVVSETVAQPTAAVVTAPSAAPVVEPTPVVAPAPPVVSTPIAVGTPTVVVPTPVVTETASQPAVVSPVPEPAVVVESTSAPLVFNASKETNLNAALGEVANSTAMSVENIDSVREFGVETPAVTPASTQPTAVPSMVQPAVSTDPKVLTKKAGFANSKFFMVVAIAFFLASCVFLGYEVYNYFQLVK